FTSLVVVTGHQPVLAHPGVWVKNACVDAVAQRAGGTGLNVVVDSDICSTQCITAPAGTAEAPLRASLCFDAPQPPQPWEETRTHSRKQLLGFGDAVADHQRANWNIEPVAADYWGAITEYESESLPELLTRARVVQEAKWGWNNLEVALSQLSRTDSFLKLLLHICQNAMAFHHVYNASVRAYRAANGVKNHRHPVPDLAKTQQGLELPFWIWKSGASQRQPLYACCTDSSLALSTGTELIAEIPIADVPTAIAELKQFSSDWNIRPRALITTLYLRLFIADLFVHGIGGAKYDEITDQIIRDFLHLQPPAYLTLTATLRLPIVSSTSSADDVRKLKRSLRDLTYNPVAALSLPETHPLAIEQRKLVAETQSGDREHSRERHQKFLDIRRQLKPLIDERREILQRELHEAQHQLAANQILGNREYAAILYPEETLLELLNSVRNGIG
ncbi:MAG: flagellar protein FliT, partial [Planctomycetaceae bacterium]|nr:flagellar protein FliT [Planctomycetaceae bacterium]